MNEAAPLPDAVRRVVQRWNPGSSSARADIAGTAPGVRVYVTGPPRAGGGEVRQILHDSDCCSVVGHETDSDVVVLAVDAASVIGREELQLISGAAARGAPVVVALTGVDVYGDWPAVRRRDGELLAAHSAALARSPIVPVSPNRRCALIPAVNGVVRPGDGVFAGSALARTRAMIEAEIENLRAAGPDADLLDERSRLLADRDGRRTERMALVRSRVQRVRGDLSRRIVDATRDCAVSARAWAEHASRAELRGVPARLQNAIDRHTQTLDAAVVDALNGTAISHGRGPQVPAEASVRARGLEERVTVVVGASAGLGLGRIAVTPLEMIPALNFASIPVTLALGGLAAWWLTRTRSLMADRATVGSWIDQSMSAVRAHWEQRLQSVLIDAEADLGSVVMAESRERVASAQARVAAIDAELRERARVRAGRLAACERDLATLSTQA